MEDRVNHIQKTGENPLPQNPFFLSSQEKLVDKMAILCGSGFASEKKDASRFNVEENQISTNGEITKFRAGKVKEKRTISETNWVAQKSQYLLLFLKPFSGTSSFIYPEKKKLILGIDVPSFIIPGKGIVEKKSVSKGIRRRGSLRKKASRSRKNRWVGRRIKRSLTRWIPSFPSCR